ncbi:class I adenylate-forming enzyme family protein [Rhodococcoides fascians]|uniref:class I adenylate-forming enzyme family protein n=1 Tax=Rhodococcoides fascians TaxID=1828 RepID=UPI0005638077|nr:class I adenylate-forming enzyme family protein [Rhodococcus fascians]
MRTERSTFDVLWRNAVETHRESVFLIYRSAAGDDRSWTYGEFDELVDAAAGLLGDMGSSADAPVHIALKNCPEFVVLWLAAARLGTWIVSVDPASPSREIASQIRRSGAVVGICGKDRSDVYRAGAAHSPMHVIEIDELAGQPGTVFGRPKAATNPTPSPTPSDRLALMFTSGTTSTPKGVVLTQNNYHYVSVTMANVLSLEPRHRWFVTLPLFHANAQYYCIGPAIAAGSSVALTASFSASRWPEQAASLEVTHASLFAAPIRMILARRAPQIPRLALDHVWFAQSLGEQHYKDFAAMVGCRPRQLYGMTETTAVVTADMSDEPSNDTIGTPLPGRTVRLLDPATGAAAGLGEAGVVAVVGTRGVDLFDGYLDDPDNTANTLRDTDDETVLYTGDLATRDAAGVMRFVGRIDDVIKVAGENVSLSEIEAAVAQAPGVLEAAVVAEADLIRDHVPVAFVVARDRSNPPSSDDLDEWAAVNLSPQSRPRRWTVIDDLPRTSVGKVRRFRLTAASETIS